MTQIELYEFLEEKVVQYNQPIFIESDPIQILHAFSSKEDIEIAGFLTAIISWGNRKMIIKSSHKMMQILGNTPYDFVRSHSENDLKRLEYFVHRTFNGEDFAALIKGLKHIYEKHGGLENVFTTTLSPTSLQPNIHHLKKLMFEIEHPERTQKHISDPLNNSAAKRINI